jgi:hypothetical protein
MQSHAGSYASCYSPSSRLPNMIITTMTQVNSLLWRGVWEGKFISATNCERKAVWFRLAETAGLGESSNNELLSWSVIE